MSLRRRHDPQFDTEVYEIKIDDDFLMSSLFTVGEVELARLGLAACAGTGLDVVVGGLGLGYTAVTVLEDVRVRSLIVVEALMAAHLLPGGRVRSVVQQPPDRSYLAVLADAFATAEATVVSFNNPLPARTATNTVYLTRT